MLLKIKLRYAVLTNLLILTWLTVEYLLGLQDNYIALYPYTSALSVGFFFFCYQKAFTEETELRQGSFSFKQGILSGFLLSLFTGLIAGPVHYWFYKFINPELIGNILQHTIAQSHAAPEVLAHFINRPALTFQAMLYTFLAGILVSLILAWRMRTLK
jgi:hypothetical protein